MKKSKGFTLVELVVVIAILGILAGIAIPRFMDAQAAARGSKIVADMRMLESALNVYMVNHTLPDNTSINLDILLNSTPPYISSIPKPPNGRAIFPKGFEVNINGSKSSYSIHNSSSKNSTKIVVVYMICYGKTSDGQPLAGNTLSINDLLTME
jgi:prepilin-type N-terminal cleavage/methylation domain-containing protein